MANAEELFDKRFRETIHPYGDGIRPEETIIADFAEHLTGGAVLDLGSGDGRLSRAFALGGNDVTAVDISSEALGQLGIDVQLDGTDEHFTVHKHDLSDSRGLEELLSGQSFDVILLADTLHLLSEAEAREVLRIANAALDEGEHSGILIRGPLPSERFQNVKEQGGRAIWSKRELEQAAGSAGLKVGHYNDIDLPPVHPGGEGQSVFTAVLEKNDLHRRITYEDLAVTDF